MTVNYTGGSRASHKRQSRRTLLDVTGAPTYTSTAANRAASAHLTNLRTRQLAFASKHKSRGASHGWQSPPTFEFAHAREPTPQMQGRSATEDAKASTSRGENDRQAGPSSLQWTPKSVTRTKVSEEDRRRVLASKNWAGLRANPQWQPPRPAPLTLAPPQKRPRVRSPSPGYVPLSPPPPGGFLRGSSVELEGAVTAGRDDEIVDYESSESEDIVVLVPEKQRPPRELQSGSPASAIEIRRSAFASTSGTPMLDQSSEKPTTPWQSRSPGSPNQSSLRWSGRKKSTSLSVTGMFRTSPPSTSPTQLVHPADIDIRYAQDVSGLRRLSLEDRQPTPPLPSGSDRPSSFDVLDFSPPSALLKDFADNELAGRPSKPARTGFERDQIDLETVATQPTCGDESPSPHRQTTQLAQPASQEVALRLASNPPQLPPPPPKTPDEDVGEEMLVKAPSGWPVSGPELPPLAYLPRDYEGMIDTAPVDDDTIKPPFADAAEKGIRLVSERMGLGCLSLTSEQADRLVMREGALRKSGVPPIEWAWVDEDQELAHDSVDDWDENDEGWDSDELEMLTYGVIVPPPRAVPPSRLDPGQLFDDKDETGILEP